VSGAREVYERLTQPGATAAPGILLTYSADEPAPDRVVALREPRDPTGAGPLAVGVIGAGQFARMILLPALRKTEARLVSIASTTGLSARHLGKKFGFRRATTDVESILRDPEIDTVFILTRHDSHATLVAAALAAGKHVFVEKPLALTAEELASVERARSDNPSPVLLVGFNREFAPLSRVMRGFLVKRRGPASIIATVNAGSLPSGHWALDARKGGGRIIGEGCHWLDLMVFLLDARVVRVSASAEERRDGGHADDPSVTICLTFADGSTGTLHYLTGGHRSYPKERVDVFFDGCVLTLRNFVELQAFGVQGFRGVRKWRQDKGHRAEVEAFVRSIAGGRESPIPFERLTHVTRVALAVMESLSNGARVALPAADAAWPQAAPGVTACIPVA
jgi:predicted dehydrogenase